MALKPYLVEMISRKHAPRVRGKRHHHYTVCAKCGERQPLLEEPCPVQGLPADYVPRRRQRRKAG